MPRTVSIICAAAWVWLSAWPYVPVEWVHAADESEVEEFAHPKRRPLVVLKQTRIKGRVFILSDDGSDSAARDLKVEVRTSDGEDLLFDTKTDDHGTYLLPDLDVGLYRLVMGLLEVELKVEDPGELPAHTRRVPKTIITFIPQEMWVEGGEGEEDEESR